MLGVQIHDVWIIFYDFVRESATVISPKIAPHLLCGQTEVARLRMSKQVPLARVYVVVIHLSPFCARGSGALQERWVHW
jgi:hypothetical protein